MSRYIDAEYDLHKLPFYYDFSDDELIAIHSALKGIPTADVVEVVRGEWIKITDVDIKLMGSQIKEVHYKCSVCGGESYFDTNYCPNCGAKMYTRGEADEKIH